MALQSPSAWPGRSRRRLLVVLAGLLLAFAFNITDSTGASPATAHNGADRSRSLTIIGREDFDFIDGPEGNTDVWVLDDFAYIGTRGTATGCANGTGVKIIDVSDPENPAFVNNIPKPQTQVNDVKAIRADTPFFHGDLLGHSNEDVCPGSTADSTGIELYGVSDPLNPAHLSSIRPLDSLFGFPLAVHNLYLFQRDHEVFVLLVTEGLFDNFQIWDITDPTSPVLRSTWGAEQICDPGVALCADPASIIQTWLARGRGTSANRFLHDVWASDDGETAYLSNWDAGMIILDISDVDSPVFLSAGPFAGPDDEGNSHAAVPARGGNLVVETGEDFEHQRIALTVDSGTLAGQQFGGTEDVGGAPPPRFATVGAVSGELVLVGRGCDTDPYPSAFALGDIALTSGGTCTFSEKILRAQQEGAIAAVIANSIPGGAPLGNWTAPDPAIAIPALFISTADGDALEANLAPGDTGTIDPDELTFNPWGFVRIYDTSDPTDPALLSIFHTTNSLNLNGPPDPRGTYSVHNVFVRGDTAFFSWYSDGLLLLDISQPDAPREIARFNDTSTQFEAQNGGIQNVWGVHVSDELIFASDRNGGLYILKLVS